MADTRDTVSEEPQTDDLRDSIIDDLRTDIGDGLIDTYVVPGVDLWARVAVESWADTAASLKQRGFEFFDFLSAIDWMPSPYGYSEEDPFSEINEVVETERTVDSVAEVAAGEMPHGYTGGETRFQMLARFTDLDRHVGITVKADVPDSLEVPTIVPTFSGANWHEREAHEMYGLTFVDHPDLRKLYLPSGFEGHPLRKDFPLLSRHIKPWPGIADVEPMAGGDDS